MPAPNKTRFALLGLLTFGPMSGYDIKQMFERSLNYFWNESYGQIYPMLKKMAGEGLTLGRKEHDEGKRERIVYSLSPSGGEAFREWLTQPAEPMRERNELLMKLFFGRHAPLETTRAHLRTARDRYAAQLEEYDRLEVTLRSDCIGDPDQPYWLITLSYGQHQTRALKQWCEESLAALAAQDHNADAHSAETAATGMNKAPEAPPQD